MLYRVLAGVALMAWMRFARGGRWPSRRQWRNALLVGALMLGGGMGGTAYAEQTVGSGLVVAFIAIVPVLMVALNGVLGTYHGKGEVAGIAVGVSGVLLLTQGAGFQASPAGLTRAVERALELGTADADAVRLILEQRRERPTGLFCLDGRLHLKLVGVPAPDLSAYAGLMAEVMP